MMQAFTNFVGVSFYYAIFFALINIGALYYFTRDQAPGVVPLALKKTITNKTFRVEKEIIDGKQYVNCTFDGAELIFKGTRPFSLNYNKFSRPAPRIKFEDSARLTIEMLAALYSDPVFRPVIEATFEDIKTGGIKQPKQGTRQTGCRTDSP